MSQLSYCRPTTAAAILPDHLHAIWTLPEGSNDFPLCWRLIIELSIMHDNFSTSRSFPHPPHQSGQTWPGVTSGGLAAFVVSPIRAGRNFAGGLGRRRGNRFGMRREMILAMGSFA